MPIYFSKESINLLKGKNIGYDNIREFITLIDRKDKTIQFDITHINALIKFINDVYKIKKINKKVKRLGLFHILSQKNKLKTLHVVNDFTDEIKKTKLFNEFLLKNNLKNSLFITDKNSKLKIIKSARNIPSLKVIEEEGANVYDILKYKNVIFTTSSIKTFQERIIK